MRNILLFEKNREKISHLVFLLKLTDIHCTVARTVEEFINWVSADRLQVVHFDLFLLCSLKGDELEEKILAEMSDYATVPVVYAKREGDFVPEPLSADIITCHPDNLLSCLKKCLVVDTKPSAEENQNVKSC